VALYGSEFWVINKAEDRYLENFEMWCWKRMLKVDWTEFRTNDSVLNEISEPRGLLRSIEERRWKIIGHTLRHEEELHHRILEGQIEGKRGRGCPRTTLIKTIIGDAGLRTYEELKIMASNREVWREQGRML